MQRAVVNTVLLASSTIPLLFLATLVSALFFSSFVPDQFVTTPVHLQYGYVGKYDPAVFLFFLFPKNKVMNE